MGSETMGRTVTQRGRQDQDARRRRFAAFFPRLFAFALSMVGNEAHARKVVIETFSQVFAHPAHLSDQQFSMAVFSLARSLCRDARPDGRRNDGDLLGSEREVLSLLFDAQLSRGEVGMVTGLEDEEVRAEMVSGLRKLRGPNGGSIIPAFLRRR